MKFKSGDIIEIRSTNSLKNEFGESLFLTPIIGILGGRKVRFHSKHSLRTNHIFVVYNGKLYTIPTRWLHDKQ